MNSVSVTRHKGIGLPKLSIAISQTRSVRLQIATKFQNSDQLFDHPLSEEFVSLRHKLSRAAFAFPHNYFESHCTRHTTVVLWQTKTNDLTITSWMSNASSIFSEQLKSLQCAFEVKDAGLSLSPDGHFMIHGTKLSYTRI